MEKKLEVQGDVALRISSLPNGAKPIEKKPLALGDVSGHAHIVEPETKQGKWDLFEFNGKMYVVTGHDGAQLRHVRLKSGQQADHNPIKLQPNTCYEVILQNEYNPEADAFERVFD